MCFSSQKKIEANRKLIKDNSNIFEVLKTIAKENIEMVKSLDLVQNKLELLEPSQDKEVIKLDNQIAKTIKKLRKQLEKAAKNDKYKKAIKTLKQLEILVVERGITNISKTSTDLSDFKIEDGKLIKYLGNGGEVIIPNNVEIISKSAFENNNAISVIKASEGLKVIEEKAFSMCKSLSSIELPKTVTLIGDSAFYNCSSLEFVVIEDGLLSIGHYAFAKCPSLKAITIPKSVNKIGQHAFEWDKNLNRKSKRKIKKINKKSLK